MSNRDWSLVFFTSLAQWSVGIILWLTWPVIYSQVRSPIFETGLSLTNPVLLSLVFIGSRHTQFISTSRQSGKCPAGTQQPGQAHG